MYQVAKNYPGSVTYFTLSEMVAGLHILRVEYGTEISKILDR